MPLVVLSETARRKRAMLKWGSLGVALCGVAAVLAFVLGTGGEAGRVFARTLAYSSIGMVVAILAIDRILYLPVFEIPAAIALACLLVFAALVATFALFQQPYSRLAVLVAGVFFLLWTETGYRLIIRGRQLRLGYVDATVPSALHAGEKTANGRAEALQLIPVREVGDTQGIDGIVIDLQEKSYYERDLLIAECKLANLRIYSVERVFEFTEGRVLHDRIDDTFLEEAQGHELFGMFKRAADVVTVVLSAPIVLPLATLVALAIRLDSDGPAIFRQERVGRGGTTFRLYKFRTMRVAGDDAPAQFAQRGDPRVTRIGHVLRRFRLDELPQLWNVLRGDMSLIGPRPEQTSFVQQFVRKFPQYHYRHMVRPGLSGWAQVHHGYAASEEATSVKLQFDLYYVKHLSFSLDAVIALRTVRTILTGFGAR